MVTCVVTFVGCWQVAEPAVSVDSARLPLLLARDVLRDVVQSKSLQPYSNLST